MAVHRHRDRADRCGHRRLALAPQRHQRLGARLSRATERDVRVALAGYGLAGRTFHGRLIAASPGFRVVAVITANRQRQDAARADFPEARVLASADELWGDPESVDLVVVATATGSHAALAERAIDAGRHVVVEKPLAPTAAEARRLAEKAAARGVQLVPFHNRRWDGDHLTLRRLIEEGALGTVLRHESRFDRWRPEPVPSAWRESLPASQGGGVRLDLGIHLVDQALTLHGPASAVYAEVAARRGGADDDVFIALAHASGVISHLWANAVAAVVGPRLRVLGSRGGYTVDGLDGQEEALRAGRRPDEPGFGVEPRERWGRLERGPGDVTAVATEPGRWLSFYAALRRCLAGDGECPVSPADAIAALEVLDAARASAESGAVQRCS